MHYNLKQLLIDSNNCFKTDKELVNFVKQYFNIYTKINQTIKYEIKFDCNDEKENNENLKGLSELRLNLYKNNENFKNLLDNVFKIFDIYNDIYNRCEDIIDLVNSNNIRFLEKELSSSGENESDIINFYILKINNIVDKFKNINLNF